MHNCLFHYYWNIAQNFIHRQPLPYDFIFNLATFKCKHFEYQFIYKSSHLYLLTHVNASPMTVKQLLQQRLATTFSVSLGLYTQVLTLSDLEISIIHPADDLFP